MEAAAILASGVISGGLGFLGSKSAAKAQAQAAQSGQDVTMRMFQQAQGAAQPFVSAGQGILPTLQGLLTPGPNQTNILSQLPGFQFAQDWGQRAIRNMAALKGWGGNRLTEAANFATGTAQQGFSSLAGLLQNFASMGSSAAGTLTGAAGTAGTGIAGLLGQQGQAQAAGILGGTNALAGGASNISNLFALNALTGGGLFGGNKSPANNPAYAATTTG